MIARLLRLPRMQLAAVAVFAVAVAMAGGATSCSRNAENRLGSDSPVAATEPDAGPAVDVEVMSFLSEARALHHEANVHEQTGDIGGAAAALDRLVRARRPHEADVVPEVEEVLADTYARLAELRLREGDLDAASKDIRDGLAHAPEPTYFRGHLLEVDGIVEEDRAAMFADAGKRDEANKARARALALLHDAVEVQEKVIQRSLEAREAGK